MVLFTPTFLNQANTIKKIKKTKLKNVRKILEAPTTESPAQRETADFSSTGRKKKMKVAHADSEKTFLINTPSYVMSHLIIIDR